MALRQRSTKMLERATNTTKPRHCFYSRTGTPELQLFKFVHMEWKFTVANAILHHAALIKDAGKKRINSNAITALMAVFARRRLNKYVKCKSITLYSSILGITNDVRHDIQAKRTPIKQKTRYTNRDHILTVSLVLRKYPKVHSISTFQKKRRLSYLIINGIKLCKQNAVNQSRIFSH